ncbi:putative ribonuclease H protein [Sesbania bispinosa]|nr:putative ribonuclease H protein [Sesbania bispinosa]
MKFGAGNTSLWYEDWTGLGKLCQYVHIDDTTLTVRDLWNEGQWLFDLLATPIPVDFLTKITEIPIPPFTIDDVDKWCWSESSTGQYTSKVGYDWLLKRATTLHTGRPWRWIWHLHCPEKVRFVI